MDTFILSKASEMLLINTKLSLQIKLDILDVILRNRPAARVLTRPSLETTICAELVIACGLSIVVGKGLVHQVKNKNNSIDWFSSSKQKESESFVVLYIGCDDRTAYLAREADESRNDVLFGQSLGYPSCCINNILQLGGIPELTDCFAYYSLNNIYDALIWPISSILDASLTPHYPCNTNCRNSRGIAQARWKALLKVESLDTIRVRDSRRLYYSLDTNFVINTHREIKNFDSYLTYAAPKYFLTENACATYSR